MLGLPLGPSKHDLNFGISKKGDRMASKNLPAHFKRLRSLVLSAWRLSFSEMQLHARAVIPSSSLLCHLSPSPTRITYDIISVLIINLENMPFRIASQFKIFLKFLNFY